MRDAANARPIRPDFASVDQFGTAAPLSGNQGLIPSARCAFSANPANNDTLGIGSHTFKFVTTLGAAAAQTQVKRGSSAAITLASLLNAINGVTDATVVKGTTAFSQSIVADAVSAAVLRIRKANKQGGSAVAGTSTTLALTASITAGASAWSEANFNEVGRAPGDVTARASFVVSAAMITNGSYQLELPFTPVEFDCYVRTSSGVLKALNEAVTISGNALNFVMAGGASPNLAATDIVTVQVWGAAS